MDVMTKEGPFTRLLIPGFHTSHVEGAPELPMMNRLIEIPYGAQRPRRGDLAHDPAATGWRTWGSRTASCRPSRACRRTPIRPPGRSSTTGAAYAVARVCAGAGPRGRSGAAARRRSRTPRDLAGGRTSRRKTGSWSTIDRVPRRLRRGRPGRRGGLKAPHLQPLLRSGLRQGRWLPRISTTTTRTACATSSPWSSSPRRSSQAQLQTFVNWKIRRGFNTILAVTGTPEVGTHQGVDPGLHHEPVQ